jgi:hypothetical protein
LAFFLTPASSFSQEPDHVIGLRNAATLIFNSLQDISMKGSRFGEEQIIGF